MGIKTKNSRTALYKLQPTNRQQTCDKILLIGNEREGIDIQRGVSDLTLNP